MQTSRWHPQHIFISCRTSGFLEEAGVHVSIISKVGGIKVGLEGVGVCLDEKGEDFVVLP